VVSAIDFEHAAAYLIGNRRLYHSYVCDSRGGDGKFRNCCEANGRPKIWRYAERKSGHFKEKNMLNNRGKSAMEIGPLRQLKTRENHARADRGVHDHQPDAD
jgi:hypothetical protein